MQSAWRKMQRKRLSYSWSIAASKLKYWSAGVMRLIELSQYSMTPLLHHSMFSLDHPIRPVQNRRRNCQPDLFRRLQVNHELKLLRLLHREIGGLGAFKNFIDKSRRAPKIIGDI